MRQGWTEEELTEVLLHLSGYVGVPIIRELMMVASKAFAEFRAEQPRREPRRAQRRGKNSVAWRFENSRPRQLGGRNRYLMLILSLHHGPHDFSAALFDDYQVLAAVAEERLNRIKCSGGFPEQALAEVLRIAGVERRDIDVVVCTRTFFQRRYFTHWKPRERLREEFAASGRAREDPRDERRVGKDRRRSAYDIFDTGGFLADLGLRPRCADVLLEPPFQPRPAGLFFTDWDEALLYTADGAATRVYYSHYLFRDGTLTNLYGDDRWLGRQRAVGSLGLAYSFVTEALGWRSPAMKAN